ncbi:MAG: 50S ribosomal protein L35 [Actinobacteria bacterium]|jgi:large subunit ribosomal protein L35|nr:50S ribosomal protein L35 [Actinomycetota bacterium]
MPKIKTHKGASKRFKLSGNGKLMRSKGMKSHLRRKKSKRSKRLFGAKVQLSEAVGTRIRKLIR